jgi:iron complex transport system substrate-binding protein
MEPGMRTTLAVLLMLAVLTSACGSEEEPNRTAESAAVTIRHKFGTTQVPAGAHRVVAVGFNDQDFALALGVVPVGARQFQGGIDIAKRPWAQQQLGGRRPAIVGAEEIDFEKVAALRPDLILGIYSGMTRRDYELLSQIAPTIAQSADYVDYGEPWPEQLETTGGALGREDRAREVREQTEAEVAKARAEHPELADATLAFADGSTGRYYVYGEQDLRVRFFTELGLSTPPAVQGLVHDKFFADLSRERLSTLDATSSSSTGRRPSSSAMPPSAGLLTDGR